MFTRSRRAALVAAAATLSLLAGCASSGSGGNATTPAGSAPSTAGTSATSGPATTRGAATPVGAGFPMTVKAGNGDVTIHSQPHAIVSLSPTATEILYAVGAGRQVVAVDKDSDYPAGLPSARIDSYHLNVEALTKYHPDLVVAAGLSPAQLKQFATLGLTVLVEPAAERIDDTYAQIVQVGRVTGHAAKARALVASMKTQVAAIVTSVGTQTRPLTYYYELTPGYYSVTSSTFIGQVLAMLGLKSIADSAKGAAASGGYPQLNAEFILKSKPDYIFLADTKCCRQNTASVAGRPGWSSLPAVKDGRVIGLNDDIASRWGPRLVDLLRVVAAALKEHPVAS